MSLGETLVVQRIVAEALSQSLKGAGGELYSAVLKSLGDR
jgi:hypothetical protein